jgi:hypothetical protein
MCDLFITNFRYNKNLLDKAYEIENIDTIGRDFLTLLCTTLYFF